MEEQAKIYWSQTLELLEKSSSGVIFETWFKPLTPLYIRDNILFLKTPDTFFKGIMNSKYIHDINQNLKSASNLNELEAMIVTDDELNTGNMSNNKKSIEQRANRGNLKNKYIFETFVRGKSNELAYAAALAVSESPGITTYNPLFLYGGVGLGKTHLMHSIGNYVLDQNPDYKVIYTSSEAFMNELIFSIRENRNEEFRNKYREIDLLLIDDIQFLTEKERTQEEFFHTFNALYNANRQIVISSDQPPRELKVLEDRLRSRCGWGLTVDITLPDFETRMAILEKKAEIEHLSIPDDVTRFIAKNIVSNIRDLEGAFNKVTAYAKFARTQISIEMTKQAIKDLINDNEKREITIEYIQEVVSNYYNITPEDLRSKKRSQNISYPRQIAMYMCRKMMDLPLSKIGEKFGGRDHSTVIHGCDKISDDMEANPDLQSILIELEKKIRG